MGPLSGVRVLEFQGIGPGPFCAMMLADMGADVLVIHRLESADLGLDIERRFRVVSRGRRSVLLDLKTAAGKEAGLLLAAKADVLIEGLRPGVMERLGIGPVPCLERNSRLVYGRMTGWGQEGPLKHAAGHDINYIAVTGALHAIGRNGSKPTPPLNLLGDFGGGGMFLAFGVACALLEARVSGKGQVVDAAMVDGAALLSAAYYGMVQAGSWRLDRGANPLDSGAPWYDTYETLDGKYVSIGPIERRFYDEMLRRLGIADENLPEPRDRGGWSELRERFAVVFKSRSREDWCTVFLGSDACFAPVLDFDEATTHPASIARNAFVEVEGVRQPAPAPRYSRTPASVQRRVPEKGEGGGEALVDWGFSPGEIEDLRALGVGWCA